MTTEDDSIDQAVAARRERLKALKAAQELLNTQDEDSGQVEDKKNNENGSGEETWVLLFFFVSNSLTLMEVFFYLFIFCPILYL